MTKKDSPIRRMDVGSRREGVTQENPRHMILSVDEVTRVNSSFREKLLRLIPKAPVPQTDTGG